ncbi:hypothetical protein PVNG_05785 [Plasmodium vivax North Korean]|uniref:CYIR protein n=1 Tax=Plasmodium vivax North Korean TaxID=1035514 RepID=A0A0J9U0R2_PLAVI|nr:hypothetical protein PVNG_05785 [Plasmodium vivax North Korean]
MIYWLYYYVMKITNNSTIIRSFYNVLYFFLSYRAPHIKFVSFTDFTIHKGEFREKHVLYEYIEFYDDIKHKIYSQSVLYFAMYCKHDKKIFRFYNAVKENCTHADSCRYYEELSNLKINLVILRSKFLYIIYVNAR